MGVNPKIGVKPPKWMVKIMENPIKMDDLEGFPLFLRDYPGWLWLLPLLPPGKTNSWAGGQVLRAGYVHDNRARWQIMSRKSDLNLG